MLLITAVAVGAMAFLALRLLGAWLSHMAGSEDDADDSPPRDKL